MDFWVKDPDDTAWYEFNFASFLDAGETISSYSTTVDSFLTKVSDISTASTVSVQVTGGEAGTQSIVSCNIHTSSSNVYETEKAISIITRTA